MAIDVPVNRTSTLSIYQFFYSSNEQMFHQYKVADDGTKIKEKALYIQYCISSDGKNKNKNFKMAWFLGF